jgi:hypothetical protein
MGLHAVLSESVQVVPVIPHHPGTEILRTDAVDGLSVFCNSAQEPEAAGYPGIFKRGMSRGFDV